MPIDPQDIEAISLLDEPARRHLYEWASSQGRAVSRDEAAAATGVSRALAAFHLDRLAQAGLLSVEFRRLTGRRGPGAGRPAKLYRRSERDLDVALPDRRYLLPAELFATAIEAGRGSAPGSDVVTGARQLGAQAGIDAREKVGPTPPSDRLRDALLALLEARGYQPRLTPNGEIRLGNCPFHALVESHRELVCGMNLAIAEGLLEGLGEHELVARLDPQPGWCCVALLPAGQGADGERWIAPERIDEPGTAVPEVPAVPEATAGS